MTTLRIYCEVEHNIDEYCHDYTSGRFCEKVADDSCTSTKTRVLWRREGSELRERIKKEERGQGRKTASLFFFVLADLGNFSRNKNPAKHYCKIT